MSGRKKAILSVIGMVLILGYAAINVLSNGSKEIKLPLPASLTRLADVKLVEVKDGGGRVVLSGSFGAPTTTKSGDIERQTGLVGTAVDTDATGKAEIEISANNNVTDQEMEIEVKRLSPSTEFHLVIDGQQAATFTTDANGEAELEMSNDAKP